MPKSCETKEGTATPKIIGSQKQHLDKKKKRLTRVHVTPRNASPTPSGAKECPNDPDNTRRERTAQMIDASRGGEPNILEHEWRLTSLADKPMVNLWKGK